MTEDLRGDVRVRIISDWTISKVTLKVGRSPSFGDKQLPSFENLTTISEVVES